MAKQRKLDLRPRYIKELLRSVDYKGYKVTEAGVIYNSKGRLIKPKFLFKDKKIDYVYIDITCDGIKHRVSYHRFVYAAWHPEFEDTDEWVITTIGRRFDYRVSNLVCISKKEHLDKLASCKVYSKEEQQMIAEAYEEVKDVMTIKEFAERVQLSPKTLSKYIRRYIHGV